MSRRRYSVSIHEMLIAGEEVKITFHPESNDFQAELLGEEYADPNYRSLVNTLKKKGKEWKPTVSIPITKIGHEGLKGNDYTDLTVTGIHSRNKNIMAREDESGSVVQISSYQFADKDPDDNRSWRQSYRDDTPNYVRRLTADERHELSCLTITAKKAANERDARQREFRIGIYSAIKQAIKRDKKIFAEGQENDVLEGDPRLAGTNRRSRKK